MDLRGRERDGLDSGIVAIRSTHRGYYNSIWNLTLYVGLAGSYEINDWFGVGLCALAATGYNRQVCYPNALGQKTCFKLEWARPVTVISLPYVSVGNRMKVRIAGSSSLESGMIHLLLSVPFR